MDSIAFHEKGSTVALTELASRSTACIGERCGDVSPKAGGLQVQLLINTTVWF